MSIRVWILIIFLAFSFLMVVPWPPWSFLNDGVMIKSVEKNSTSFSVGLRQGMIINSINGNPIKNTEEYAEEISSIFNERTNITKVIINTNQGEFILFTDKNPEITISPIPKTNLKTGLDLAGGARALVKPETPITSQEMKDLIAVTSNRLNVFGISDVSIREVKDLSGNDYMLLEVAGATPTDLKELVAKQGKFEAKIGEESVFVGGSKDITDVCRFDAKCSGIRSCDSQGNTAICTFMFTVYLSEPAAQRHADITSKLGVNVTESGSRYLEKKLDLFIDGSIIDSLFISENLKGQVTTQISVQGSGSGATTEEAFKDATESMNKLQTILITGSLPFKLEIVKLDTVSPVLGKQFTKNIALLGLLVFIIVSIILFIKYRKIKITLSVILTMFSEVFITLGIAALIKWNLDAPSIAGIIAGMGTGVNDQIVIIDESVSNTNLSIRERIKRALFIIIAAFLTIIAAMIPLFWAGAGMLKGFALTTIISVSIGILITRPAFADILKRIHS